MLSRARDLAGATQIIAVDIKPYKLEAAQTFGATHVINSWQTDAVAVVLDLADGGVDYAFVVASVSHLTEEAIRMMCKGETNHSSGHVSSHFAIGFFGPTTCGAMLPERQLRGRHQFPAVSYAAVLNQESAIFPWHGGSVLPVLRRYA